MMPTVPRAKDARLGVERRHAGAGTPERREAAGRARRPPACTMPRADPNSMRAASTAVASSEGVRASTAQASNSSFIGMTRIMVRVRRGAGGRIAPSTPRYA